MWPSQNGGGFNSNNEQNQQPNQQQQHQQQQQSNLLQASHSQQPNVNNINPGLGLGGINPMLASGLSNMGGVGRFGALGGFGGLGGIPGLGGMGGIGGISGGLGNFGNGAGGNLLGGGFGNSSVGIGAFGSGTASNGLGSAPTSGSTPLGDGHMNSGLGGGAPAGSHTSLVSRTENNPIGIAPVSNSNVNNVLGNAPLNNSAALGNVAGNSGLGAPPTSSTVGIGPSNSTLGSGTGSSSLANVVGGSSLAKAVGNSSLANVGSNSVGSNFLSSNSRSGIGGDTPQDISIASDIFGQTSHTDELASKFNPSAALVEMQLELAKIPQSEKVALFHAQRMQPQLLSDDLILKFLWAEKFNPAAAARRLVRYWSDRYKLFGLEKFCLPLTLKGALKDDSLALSRGYVQLLPETDTAGRAVLYVDWSCHEPTVGYSEESMHRVFWYMAHVAMEDEKVLSKGVVMLIYPQEARLDQFDHSLWNSIAESCRMSLPIMWKSTHIVHPNRFFSIIHPVFMSSLPKDVQDRVVVHSGTKMKVLANLLRYCLPWDRIPSDIGGCVDVDFERWLSERMMKEDQLQHQKPSSNSSVFGTLLQQAQPAASPAGGAGMNGLNDQALGMINQLLHQNQGNNASDQSAILKNGIAGLNGDTNLLKNLAKSPDGSKAASGDVENGKSGDKSVAKGPKSLLKSGRKSDPRMDRAVLAKLEDPNLSLVDALRKGGFVFPNLSDSGTPQYTVVDSDNVKITQRKNQLLRRLRTAKGKAAPNNAD